MKWSRFLLVLFEIIRLFYHWLFNLFFLSINFILLICFFLAFGLFGKFKEYLATVVIILIAKVFFVFRGEKKNSNLIDLWRNKIPFLPILILGLVILSMFYVFLIGRNTVSVSTRFDLIFFNFTKSVSYPCGAVTELELSEETAKKARSYNDIFLNGTFVKDVSNERMLAKFGANNPFKIEKVWDYRFVRFYTCLFIFLFVVIYFYSFILFNVFFINKITLFFRELLTDLSKSLIYLQVSQDRLNKILEKLEKIPASQLDIICCMVNSPTAEFPGNKASQVEIAQALLEWAVSESGCGLFELEKSITDSL